MRKKGEMGSREVKSERLDYEEKKVRDWTMRRKKGEI